MKTKIKFTNIDEQDDFIQSLSLNELKKMNEKNQILFQNNGEIKPEAELENSNLIAFDEYVQKMQLSELKKMFQNKPANKQIDETEISEKSKITGLDKNVILIIETKKEKATLEQIMIYCKKLHIPYQKLIPEIFVPIY